MAADDDPIKVLAKIRKRGTQTLPSNSRYLRLGRTVDRGVFFYGNVTERAVERARFGVSKDEQNFHDQQS